MATIYSITCDVCGDVAPERDYKALVIMRYAFDVCPNCFNSNSLLMKLWEKRLDDRIDCYATEKK
jgi:hypothetical protein